MTDLTCTEDSTREFRASGLLSRLWMWRETARQHRHLARLDENALRDLGLTRDQVRRELAQPFWMRPGFGEVTSPRQADAAHMARYRQR